MMFQFVFESTEAYEQYNHYFQLGFTNNQLLPNPLM